MTSPAANITSVLKESRVFPPNPDFALAAHVPSVAYYEHLWKRAKDDPEGFWNDQANSLHWFSRWHKTLEWNPPFAKWFLGGKINACYNCVDRHLTNGRKNKVAIFWEGEPGDR